MVRAVLYTIAIKSRYMVKINDFFYIGMVLPFVAASDAFGRTDTRIRQKGRNLPYIAIFRLYMVSNTIGCKKGVKSQLQAVF